MNISQLARITGTSTAAIRQYSQLGLFHKVSAGAKDSFSESDVHATKLIHMALSVGLSFREIILVLSTNEQGGSSCRLEHALQLLDLRRKILGNKTEADKEKRRMIDLLEKELFSLF